MSFFAGHASAELPYKKARYTGPEKFGMCERSFGFLGLWD